MKPLLLASFVLAALPLIAAETQDSPLVKAAKTKNKRKATIVITNDTLLKSGGHITTTASQAPLPPAAPQPTEEQLRSEQARKAVEAKSAADRAAAEKKAQERRASAKVRTLEEQEGNTEESLYEDPALMEHRAEQTTSTSDKKPPI
jgi:hypothetical protein